MIFSRKKTDTSNKDFPYLKPWQLNHAKFVRNRVELLKLLPLQKRFCEIGVMAGDFSSKILEFNSPLELHLIDLFNCSDTSKKERFSKQNHLNFVKKRFENQVENGQVFIKKGKSWERLSEYNNHYFDIVYIDANHSFSAVTKDLEEAHSKIKEDGFIVLNDYTMYDHLGEEKYGVVEATNEFMKKHDYFLKYFVFHPMLYCDVVIQRKSQLKKEW